MADRHEIEKRLDHYVGLLDDSLAFGRRAAEEYAEADDAYRVAHARTFVEAKDAGATDQMAKAKADLATEGVRKRARMAESMDKLAVEAVRSRRTQVSAEQSKLRAFDAEAEMSRYTPEGVPS